MNQTLGNVFAVDEENCENYKKKETKFCLPTVILAVGFSIALRIGAVLRKSPYSKKTSNLK